MTDPRQIIERNRRHSEHPYLWLLEITLPSGEIIRLCRNPRQTGTVEWPTGSGTEWQEMFFALDGLEESSTTERREVTLDVSNAGGVMAAHLETLEKWRQENGREPCRVRIMQVNAGLLDDPEPCGEFHFEDAGCSLPAPMQVAKIRIGTPDYFSRPVPRRKVSRNFCAWETEDLCPFARECSRTLAECRERGKTDIFGGYPMVESGAMYV